MIKRLTSFAVLAAALALFTASAFAGEIKSYSEAAVAEAKTASKTVLLDFHADWCPVCKKQGLVFPSLVKEDKFKDVAIFKVNYDKETAIKNEFKVENQSTLIVLKGDKEMARATWVTDPKEIRALIEKGF
jgi:thioredoxin 1